MDAAHDPGAAAAREREEQVAGAAAEPIPTAAGEMRFGTASWTDPTLTRGGMFYPAGTDSAEDRLRYYASHFPLVEVDATYYALPERRMTDLWRTRTPDDFTFDLKAHALMTGQPTEVKRLPPDLRAELPAALAEKTRIYAKDLFPELQEQVWAHFIDALEPLRSSGKLGSVLLQYPRWFHPGSEQRDAILAARERLGDIASAVELRNAAWFNERNRERTLRFLADHAIPFVMVDEPQGTKSSVPPIAAVTSPRLAIVRFHGRRNELWERPGIPVVERFRYLYEPRELAEWVPKLEEAAGQAREVHVIMNNCYANYGITNAEELASMVRHVYGTSGPALADRG